MPVIFSVGAIKINAIDHTSVFNVGQNIVIGFTSSHTNNQGSGQNFGDGIIQPASVGTAGFDASTAVGTVTTNTPLAESIAV